MHSQIDNSVLEVASNLNALLAEEANLFPEVDVDGGLLAYSRIEHHEKNGVILRRS